MKEVVISDEIRNDPEALSTVEQATQVLQSLQGPSAASVTAEWSVGRDENDRRVIGLKLSDPMAEVHDHFTLEELKNRERAKSRLNWIWGDWLQERSHEDLKKLHETIQQL